MLEPCAERLTGIPRQVRLLDYLGVDHCFVHEAVPGKRLWCLSARSLNIATDHKYALCLHVRLGKSCRPKDSEAMPRYRVGRIREPAVLSAQTRCFESEAKAHRRALLGLDDVDRVDAALVRVCQAVLDRVCGRSGKTEVRRRLQRSGTVYELLRDRQDADATTRLYKLVQASSKQQNGPVLPTPGAERHGVDAMDEITASFASRYTAVRPSYKGWPRYRAARCS